jgi:hypothetical protein
MHESEHRSFTKPVEVREFPNGRTEIVRARGVVVDWFGGSTDAA